MRLHVFTDPTSLHQRSDNLLVLGPRTRITLEPDPTGRPVCVDLEVMVEIDRGTALLLTAHPAAVIERGLRPTLPLIIRNHNDPSGTLTFWFDPPLTTTVIEIGTPLVEALLVSAPLERFYHDLTLVDRLAGAFVGGLETDPSRKI